MTSNERTVRAVFEDCVNGRNLAGLATLIDAGFVGPQGRGPQGFAAPLEGLEAAFPDLHYTLEDVLAAGDRVAVRWRWTGTHTRPFNGVAPGGNAVTNDGAAVFELRDAKIVRSWVLTDRRGFLQQLGIVPADVGVPPPTRPAAATR